MAAAREGSVVRLLLFHLIYGGVGAVVFGGLVLYFDIAHLRSLTFGSGEPALVLALLFFGLFVTFGSVAMAVGVMGLADEEN